MERVKQIVRLRNGEVIIRVKENRAFLNTIQEKKVKCRCDRL